MNLTNPFSHKSNVLADSGSHDKSSLSSAGSKKSRERESSDESFIDIQNSITSKDPSSMSNSQNPSVCTNSSVELKNESLSNYSEENIENFNSSSQRSVDEVNHKTKATLKTITLLDKKIDAESLSLSLKSCEDSEIESEISEESYKDAEAKSSEEIKVKPVEEDKNKMKTKQEELEGIIKYLYETIKDTKGPFFENLEWTDKNRTEKGVKNKEHCLDSLGSLQEYYDCTMLEVADIWRNVLSLIGSVKDHTLKYVDEKYKGIDKEQLTLEAEMLQLAVDFAINYSKLKTDFLVKKVRKRIGVKEQGKSELENFMDSKTLAALYNDEDLAAMAQTVVELNASVLKGEDLDID